MCTASSSLRQKILVSACLLGHNVRYDGRHLDQRDEWLRHIQSQGRVIPICPEVEGQLPIPRTAAEICGTDGHAVLSGEAVVKNLNGEDVSEHFIAGAKHALELCQQYGIRIAILAESSPSCGSNTIHAGNFSGTTKPGVGVTAALLIGHGIAVFNQHQIADAAELLQSLLIRDQND